MDLPDQPLGGQPRPPFGQSMPAISFRPPFPENKLGVPRPIPSSMVTSGALHNFDELSSVRKVNHVSGDSVRPAVMHEVPPQVPNRLGERSGSVFVSAPNAVSVHSRLDERMPGPSFNPGPIRPRVGARMSAPFHRNDNPAPRRHFGPRPPPARPPPTLVRPTPVRDSAGIYARLPNTISKQGVEVNLLVPGHQLYWSVALRPLQFYPDTTLRLVDTDQPEQGAECFNLR